MKKILNLLVIITLIWTSTTSLVACDKPDNNKIKRNNKLKEPVPKFEQPPENSNWKLITDWEDEEKNRGKTYIGIWKNGLYYEIVDWKANPANPKWPLYHFKIVYRWDSVGEPIIPTINKNTGEITKWK